MAADVRQMSGQRQTEPAEFAEHAHPIIRLGNVSVPTITLYRAPKAKDTEAAVLIFPGGGNSILASDLEGSEICEWLNSIGVTRTRRTAARLSAPQDRKVGWGAGGGLLL